MASAAQPRPTPAWALDFPEPKATPPKISQEELAELVRTKSAGVDYLVVDVRRSDIEVSLPAASKSASAADHRIPHPASRTTYTLARSLTITPHRSPHAPTRPTPPQALIKGAINVPAQTFYQTLPTLLHLLAPIPAVIFHCQSSLGRGPRCAGWYADALPPGAASRALVLDGGIKAWLARWAGDADMTLAVPGAAAVDYPPLVLEPEVVKALGGARPGAG